MSWLFRQVLGSSEFALRSLSIFSTLGSCWLISKLLTRFGGTRNAWAGAIVASIVLIAHPQICFNARPYSPAIFSSLLALYSLLAWAETRNRATWFFYCVGCSLTILFHYLFALALVPHPWLIRSRLRDDRTFLLAWSTAIVAVGFALLPFSWHFFEVLNRAPEYQFRSSPTLFSSFQAIFFEEGIFAIALVTLGLGLLRPRPRIQPNSFRGFRIAMFFWALGPVAVLALFWVTGIRLNVDRYYYWRLPVIGLFTALSLDLLNSRRIVAFPLLLLAFIAPSLLLPASSGGWREAIQWVTAQHDESGDCHVAAYTGLIEAASSKWVLNSECHDYLLSPLAHYGNTAGSSIIPTLTAHSVELFRTSVVSLFRENNQLVTYLPADNSAVRNETTKISAQHGFRVAARRVFGNIEVIHFTRVSGLVSGIDG